jgi:hypothetical protein
MEQLCQTRPVVGRAKPNQLADVFPVFCFVHYFEKIAGDADPDRVADDVHSPVIPVSSRYCRIWSRRAPAMCGRLLSAISTWLNLLYGI